jgi:inhibitor of KinA
MSPLGDSAIVVELGTNIELDTHRKVQELSSYLEGNILQAMTEYVPDFTSVTVYYDCAQAASLLAKFRVASPYEVMQRLLEEILAKIKVKGEHKPEVVEIPVCYGGEFGPDLEYVAKHNHLSPEEVIEIHSAGTYLIYMIGFAPGFPYLGGLSEKIAVPRRESPRLNIPAGTVGIAGNQTGVYPIETPGGWQLIGKTPLRLFNPKQSPPILLKAGNNIRFKPISHIEYQEIMGVRS